MVDETKLLIPKGFFRVAESDMLSGKATAFFNKERNKLIIILDDEIIIGPFNTAKIEVVHHVLTDVKEMKGRYNGI